MLLLSWYFCFGLILIMVPNAFPDCLSNLSVPTLCLKDPQIGNENSSRTSSDGQGDSVEQICLVISNSKTRTLHQLTIIYWNVLM